MKKTWIVACALLFIAIAGFADSPGPGPVSDEVLAAILGPVAGASCETKAGGVGEVRFVAAVAGEKALCSVDCQNGTSVSCSSNTSCTAVQRNCTTALQRGYVTCNGVTTYCPAQCCSSQDFCCLCNGRGYCMDCCRCANPTWSDTLCRYECFGG
jgi:hypothetical protein